MISSCRKECHCVQYPRLAGLFTEQGLIVGEMCCGVGMLVVEIGVRLGCGRGSCWKSVVIF
jgi:hypothetical protein